MPSIKQRIKNVNKEISILIALIPAFIIFVIYIPALQNGFLDWDDGIYVFDNQHIKSIDLGFFRWAITDLSTGFWHPLLWFSIALDYRIWGLNPLGYHLTNILLHAVNAILVFILTVRLNRYCILNNNKTIIAGFVTAFFFGIHPLRVESVAWVVERKDVLSAFFFLLSLITYLKYVTSLSPKKLLFYFGSLLFFISALMSKSMAVSLPIVLLILDFFPLNRLTIEEGLKNVKGVIIEKLPFFLAGAISSFITIKGHAPVEAFGSVSFVSRVFIALNGFVFYLVKIVFPFNLAPLYPHPGEIDIMGIRYPGSVFGLIIITVFCIQSLNSGKKIFIAIWLYYIVTLIPVIGILKIGRFFAADRFTYLPSVGIHILAGLGVAAIFESCKKKYILIFFLILILLSAMMMFKTVRQIAIWHDNVTLWSTEIKLHPDVLISYYNRGTAYLDMKKYPQAINDLSKASESPIYTMRAYANRGIAYYKMGSYNEAVSDLSRAIHFGSKSADDYFYRGDASFHLGNYPSAMEDFHTVIQLNPTDAEAYYKLGLLYSKLGDEQRALFFYIKADALGWKP